MGVVTTEKLENTTTKSFHQSWPVKHLPAQHTLPLPGIPLNILECLLWRLWTELCPLPPPPNSYVDAHLQYHYMWRKGLWILKIFCRVPLSAFDFLEPRLVITYQNSMEILLMCLLLCKLCFSSQMFLLPPENCCSSFSHMYTSALSFSHVCYVKARWQALLSYKITLKKSPLKKISPLLCISVPFTT